MSVQLTKHIKYVAVYHSACMVWECVCGVCTVFC